MVDHLVVCPAPPDTQPGGGRRASRRSTLPRIGSLTWCSTSVLGPNMWQTITFTHEPRAFPARRVAGRRAAVRLVGTPLAAATLEKIEWNGVIGYILSVLITRWWTAYDAPLQRH